MAVCPTSRLYAEGVDAEALTKIAQAGVFQATPVGSFPTDRTEKNYALVSSDQAVNLFPLLAKPYDGFIEYIKGEDTIDEESMLVMHGAMMGFSLSTATAYQNDSAALVSEALLERGVLSPMRKSDVELALHEAISNAVVHGNLSVQSNMQGELAKFAQFAQELQNRMSSPDALKRVDIACTWDHEFLDVVIIDKGRGYDMSMLPRDVDPFAPAGRGLAIIRSLALSMTVSQGGRISTLRFLT